MSGNTITYAFAGIFTVFIITAPAVSLWFLLFPLALIISVQTRTWMEKRDQRTH